MPEFKVSYEDLQNVITAGTALEIILSQAIDDRNMGSDKRVSSAFVDYLEDIVGNIWAVINHAYDSVLEKTECQCDSDL